MAPGVKSSLLLTKIFAWVLLVIELLIAAGIWYIYESGKPLAAEYGGFAYQGGIWMALFASFFIVPLMLAIWVLLLLAIFWLERTIHTISTIGSFSRRTKWAKWLHLATTGFMLKFILLVALERRVPSNWLTYVSIVVFLISLIGGILTPLYIVIFIRKSLTKNAS